MLDLLRRLFLEALTLPHIAARRLIGLDLPLSAFVMVVVLSVSAYSAIFGALMLMAGPAPEGAFVLSPVSVGLFNLVANLLMIVLTFGIGRMFGGTGSFEMTVQVMSGFIAVSAVLQVGALLISAISVPLGLSATLLILIWSFWAATHFIAELHGFEDRLKVFGGMLMSLFGLSMIASIVLLSLGIQVEGLQQQ
ncbi:YIP1 family protein [Halovulum sp. GXIMD14793]